MARSQTRLNSLRFNQLAFLHYGAVPTSRRANGVLKRDVI